MDAPNVPSIGAVSCGAGGGDLLGGAGNGGSCAGGGMVESLRAQLSIVEQRAAAAGEYRELSDGCVALPRHFLDAS